jgi:tungstate transport system substrate-binding protein
MIPSVVTHALHGQRGYIGSMLQTFTNPRRRHGSARRLLAAPIIGLLAAAFMLVAPGLASADSASTLTVVGTSDVSDSGLIPNLIQPAFHAAFPQFTFTYKPSATGAAIKAAELGTGGPSVLIVHAASLENQFVGGGFSYNHQYGNAIFTNDFVLAGSTADPANIATAAPHNIAQAFADVAAKGVAGQASFLSRGGDTGASGTTVEEHQIWALVNSAGLTPAGVYLCNVSNTSALADGGGMTPIAAPSQELPGGGCPDNGTVEGQMQGGATDLPAWYIYNGGVSQAANVTDANACTETGAIANGCYVLTDRSTYDYLTDGALPAGGTTTIPNLKVVTRDNSASAPGGINALINYFHAYIINPNVAGEAVNLAAAQDFIGFITSPTIQNALGSYLNDAGDPDGAPFKPTASPLISATGLPASIPAGQSVTVSGTVTNRQPGFAAPASQPVRVDDVVAGLDVPIASGTTNASGGYAVTFVPPVTGSYAVTTGSISLTENASLSPVYGDILSPASSAATAVTVGGKVAISKTTASTGAIQVSGTVGPAGPADGNAKVALLARPSTSTGAFTQIGGASVGSGQSKYAAQGSLKGGKWTIEVQYTDPGSFAAVTSGTQTVTVPSQTNTVKFKKVTIKKGKATVSGTLGEAPASSSATVRLYAIALSKVTTTKQKTKKAIRAAIRSELRAKADAATFRQVAKATVKAGKTTYTITRTFKRGYRYALQLEYVHSGQTSAYSGFKYVTVS